MPDAAATQAFLKIDTGTHNSVIHSLLPSSSGKFFITAASDQMVRIWDMATRKEIRKILGQIGPGQIGQVKGLALTPDDRYLAVNVNMANDGEPPHSLLRFYDLQNGNLVRVFDHGGTLSSIDFSPDGRYLAAGEITSNNIYLYLSEQILTAANIVPARILSSTYQPFGVRFFQQGGDYRLVYGEWDLVGNQHLASLFALKTGAHKELSLPDLGAPEYFAISHRHIAVCGHHFRSIWILDYQFNPIQQIDSGPHPAGLVFSPDGRYLLAGTKSAASGDPSDCCVYDFASGFSLLTTYHGHDFVVRAVAYLNPSTVVTAGGSSFDIHFWNPLTGELQHKITGAGQVVYAVGWKGNKSIGYGNVQRERKDLNNLAPLQKALDLQDLKIKTLEPDEAESYQRVADRLSDHYLEIPPGENVNLFVMPEGECLTYFKEPGWYYAEVFGFSQDGTIFTGARGGWMRAYLPIRDGYSSPKYLLGHTDTIWDLAVQDDWLVSGSADQTLRLWYLPDLRDRAAPGSLYPALTIFIARDGEWVIWSQSGFYTASMDGDRYIGFHISQGENQEGLFYPSDRFIKQLYRPGLIRAILETGSEDRALAKLAMHRQDIGQILPPVVELFSPSTATYTAAAASLHFEVRPAEAAVERIWVLHNDQFLWQQAGDDISNGGSFELQVSLFPGENRFKILAESKAAKSLPVVATWLLEESQSMQWPTDTLSFGMPVEGDGTAPPESDKNLPVLLPRTVILEFEVPRPARQRVRLEITSDGEPIWEHTGKPAARKGRYRVSLPVTPGNHVIEIWDKSTHTPRSLMSWSFQQKDAGRVIASRGS